MPDLQSAFFVTAVPSFYKNLLFRQLQSDLRISILFTNSTKIKRHGDFFNYLPETGVLRTENLSFLKKVKLGLTTARTSQRVYFGSWDNLYSWVLIFLLPRNRNYLIVESSIFEFSEKGLRQKGLNLLKKLFLSRMRTCIASGQPHRMLLQHLGFGGSIRLSQGVGLLDFSYPPASRPEIQHPVTEFLYIGRLALVKGTDTLLEAFRQLPDCRLHLVGMPENDFKLPELLNVVWHGYKNRDELSAIFNATQVFILPSVAEPWGLVVEEALYHGLPVIVSDKVGCRMDVVDRYQVGYTFQVGDLDALCRSIRQMQAPQHYNAFLQHICGISFSQRQKHYVDSFLS